MALALSAIFGAAVSAATRTDAPEFVVPAQGLWLDGRLSRCFTDDNAGCRNRNMGHFDSLYR